MPVLLCAAYAATVLPAALCLALLRCLLGVIHVTKFNAIQSNQLSYSTLCRCGRTAAFLAQPTASMTQSRRGNLICGALWTPRCHIPVMLRSSDASCDSKQAVFPFGHSLSYTTWAVKWAAVHLSKTVAELRAGLALPLTLRYIMIIRIPPCVWIPQVISAVHSAVNRCLL